MPTSPTFKYRGPDKRCPFPFNRDNSTFRPDPGFDDFVDLTASGGDQGLAEACRIWWLLDSVTMTPAGSATFNYLPPPDGPGGSVTSTYSAGPVTVTDTLEPFERSQRVSNVFMQDVGMAFNISYISSKWRLYYVFFASGPVVGGGAFYNISNPAYLYGSPATTGTCNLFGYTLDWGAEAVGTVGGSQFVSGASMSFSSSFYTLV